MLKYRRLSTAELEALEDEFVKFLSAQSISAPDWQQIKSENTEKQEALIGMFSDIVMERALRNIEYLELTTQDEIKIFHMKNDSGRLLGLKVKDERVNLMDDEQLNTLFKDKESVLSHNPQVYELEKVYTKTKAEEAFFLINLGASVTNNTLYSFIDALIKDKA